ncbi:hypothetical protein ABIF26_006500 [Bradyrhizobium elkanii]|uniref:GIY-YIG nuclease family protein n=1 Tax=Bradyrhizobium elkanii TaxID=29448 RepID=UPI00351114A1
MGAIEAVNLFSARPAPKRRELPKYVHFEKSRQGVDRYYFRKDKDSPRIRLRSQPGSVEFLAEYRDALAGKSSPPQSFVYFARAGNKVKIGVSKNPRQRLGELKTGNSNKVRIYYVTPGDAQMERDLHKLFAEFRVNGEWFLYAEPIRNWIAQDEARRLAAKELSK